MVVQQSVGIFLCMSPYESGPVVSVTLRFRDTREYALEAILENAFTHLFPEWSVGLRKYTEIIFVHNIKFFR